MGKLVCRPWHSIHSGLQALLGGTKQWHTIERHLWPYYLRIIWSDGPTGRWASTGMLAEGMSFLLILPSGRNRPARHNGRQRCKPWQHAISAELPSLRARVSLVNRAKTGVAATTGETF